MRNVVLLLALLLAPPYEVSGALIELTGTATVTDVFFPRGGIPEFLAELPEVGDTATFSVSYQDSGFASDSVSSPTSAQYAYSGLSSFAIDFGRNGRFERDVRRINIGTHFRDSWSILPVFVFVNGERWSVSINFQDHLTFTDDSLRTTIDTDRFLNPSRSHLEDFVRFLSPNFGDFTLAIESATFVTSIPLPPTVALLLLGLVALRLRARA